MEMGEKIRILRLKKEMTLEELGSKVGVGKSTVRKWENGIIANMKRDKIKLLADALETTPAYLMGWEDETKEDPDPDIRRIARARKEMPDKDKEKMMKILKASFEDYFSDDYKDDDLDE